MLETIIIKTLVEMEREQWRQIAEAIKNMDDGIKKIIGRDRAIIDIEKMKELTVILNNSDTAKSVSQEDKDEAVKFCDDMLETLKSIKVEGEEGERYTHDEIGFLFKLIEVEESLNDVVIDIRVGLQEAKLTIPEYEKLRAMILASISSVETMLKEGNFTKDYTPTERCTKEADLVLERLRDLIKIL